MDDRMVHYFAALEQLLTRGAGEAIQQNVAERMAFFLADTAPERKQIISAVKTAYGLRSASVHGRSIEETDMLEQFLRRASRFFRSVVQRVREFKTKEDFLNFIEDRRMS
jgi:hypothetical protein